MFLNLYIGIDNNLLLILTVEKYNFYSVKHLQEQPTTGHSEFSANQMAKCSVCPPCLHVWHHENHLENGLDLLAIAFVSVGPN